MKTKFANHVSKNSETCNTDSRSVLIRGVAHIVLIATRQVEVGEEFLFDYKVDSGDGGADVPSWARRSGPSGSSSGGGVAQPVVPSVQRRWG